MLRSDLCEYSNASIYFLHTLTDNAENLDIVIPMYNLLEYNKNYRKQQDVFGIITGTNQIVV